MLVANYSKQPPMLAKVFFFLSLLGQPRAHLSMLPVGTAALRGPFLAGGIAGMRLLHLTVRLLKAGYTFGYKAGPKFFLLPVRVPTRLFFMLNMSGTWPAACRASVNALLAWSSPATWQPAQLLRLGQGAHGAPAAATGRRAGSGPALLYRAGYEGLTANEGRAKLLDWGLFPRSTNTFIQGWLAMLLPLLPSFSAGGIASAPASNFFTQGPAGGLGGLTGHKLVVGQAGHGRMSQAGPGSTPWTRVRPRLAVRLRGRVQRRRLHTLLRAPSRAAGQLRLTRARRPRRRANRLLRIRAAHSWHSRRSATAPKAGVSLRGELAASLPEMALRKNWHSSKLPFKRSGVGAAHYAITGVAHRQPAKPAAQQTLMRSPARPLPRLANWGHGKQGCRPGASSVRTDIWQFRQTYQLKPGYMTLWREYRALYAELSPLRLFRQHRWTKYFATMRSLSGMSLLCSLELSLFFILKRAYFFLHAGDIFLLIKQGLVLIRGNLARSVLGQVYAGDCVQLVTGGQLSLRLAFAARSSAARLASWVLRVVSRPQLAQGSSAANGVWGLSRSRVKTATLSAAACATYLDIPNHLEVDFLAGSVFVVYMPVFFFELDQASLTQAPVFAMRLYNWKYIT